MKNQNRCFGQAWEGIFWGICCMKSYYKLQDCALRRNAATLNMINHCIYPKYKMGKGFREYLCILFVRLWECNYFTPC